MTLSNRSSDNFFFGDVSAGSISGAYNKKGSSRKSTLEIRRDHLDETDAELISGFFGGNGEYFAALVDRHVSMVYKFVYRYVQNSDNANDVTQEVFIKVWKNIKKFDREKNFKTWVLTIAKNTALDLIKKKKAIVFSKIEQGDMDIDTFLAPYTDNVELPEQTLNKKYVKAELDRVLQGISQAYRDVLLLRYTENLKFREISDVLGEPIDTVKSKHRRALILLKKLLTDRPDMAV
jgi:RNA polymerase sigma-70 factor (ECF subfamily)